MPALRYAIHIHAYGAYADPRLLAALAREAEDAGWDGVFVDDHLAAGSAGGGLAGIAARVTQQPVANCWVTLAAMATATQRVRLGPMVAALPRRRPWQVAGEAVTLDHLSGGRLILGVGSGTGIERSFVPFGEESELPRRAAMLDEALAVLDGLWQGQPLRFDGRHYHLDGAWLLPRPVQQPRVPVWVAGHWPHRRPFRRAARWDGVFVDAEGVDWLRGEIVPPDTLRACVRYTLAQREHQKQLHRPHGETTTHITQTSEAFDVVIGGFSPADPARAAARLAPYAEAGLTWWVEGIHQSQGTVEEARVKIRRGPPRQ